MSFSERSPHRHPAWWIPSLYLAEGLPNAVVTGMAGVALLDFGFSAAETAVYTAVLSLPWAFKPFWAPLVERLGTRREWVLAMQVAMALLLVPLAWALPERSWLPLTLCLLGGLGLASATHDIAADGFYIEALDEHRQAEWSGVRNTFFRVAVLTGSGGLVWLAGNYEKTHGAATAWTGVFLVAAAALGLFAVYDYFAIPRLEKVGGDGKEGAASQRPYASTALPRVKTTDRDHGFLHVWGQFVQKPGFLRMFAFILFYRFAEGQVQSANKAFFLAALERGGLGLHVDEVGQLYGTFGVIALMAGGILGGLAIARTGLGRQLWLMAAAMNLPNILYVWMAWAQPQSRGLIAGLIAVEQFGYGFGFAAFMVYLLYVARGPHATAHYAICSALMAVGMTVAGMVAAAALEITTSLADGGYREFFSWVMVCALVSFGVLWKLPLEKEFGKKR